jgi:hypothetical protein
LCYTLTIVPSRQSINLADDITDYYYYYYYITDYYYYYYYDITDDYDYLADELMQQRVRVLRDEHLHPET